MKRCSFIAIILIFLMILTGCKGPGGATPAPGSVNLPDVTPVPPENAPAAIPNDAIPESACTVISLDGDSVSCESNSVTVSGTAATIISGGDYLITGTLDDGMIIIDAKGEAVRLLLKSVSINSSSSAAIYIRKADSVTVQTAAGTENTLSNSGSYTPIDDNNIDAVIFSKSDITLGGSGILNVYGNGSSGHGIVSKDRVLVSGGSFNITAPRSGICGKDGVEITAGTFEINCPKTAIKAANDDDASLGYAILSSCALNLTAGNDGISAAAYLKLFNVELTLDAAERGINCDGDITVSGCNLDIVSSDDALHAKGNITVHSADMRVSSGDDAFHSDAAITINSGSIDIYRSHEGFEGLTVTVNGGNIGIVSDDDGINASGGDSSDVSGDNPDPLSVEPDAYICITGGTVNVDAGGDGLDSNGGIFVTGGDIRVSGSTRSADGAIDYNGNAVITGGTLIAAGMSGMAQNFGSASTQGAILINVGSRSAGSAVTLLDKTSNELVSWTPGKSYDCVLISCPGISDGSEYTVTAGDYSSTVTMNGLIYGGGGFGGMGGTKPGGGMPGGSQHGGGMPGDNMQGGGMPGGNPLNGTPPAGGQPGEREGK